MNFLRKIEKGIDFIGSASLVLIVLLTSGNIVTNWLFDMRYPEVDDMVNTLFVWVTYISTGVLYKNGKQVTVDFVVDAMPPMAQKICNIFVDAFTLVISCVMTKLAWTLSLKSVNKTTPSMGIPYSIIDFALVVGFATMVVYIAVKLFVNIKELAGGKENA